MYATIRGRSGSRRRELRSAADVQRAVLQLWRNDLAEWPFPPLYESGIRYERERRKAWGEDWQDADSLRITKRGDCEDLACYRAAELVASGADEEAFPYIVFPRQGLIHVVVSRADGIPEDPSAMLGMKTSLNRIRYQLRRNRGQVVAGIRVPIGGEPVLIEGTGRTAARAVVAALDNLGRFALETGLPVPAPYFLEIGADDASPAGILESLSTAADRWRGLEPSLDGAYRSYVQPVREAVALGAQIVERVDFSNPTAFMSSISSLASLAGPYGAAIGAVLDTLNKAVAWALKEYPAYAVQLQREHYAQMDAWIAQTIFQIPGDASAAVALLYGKGWVPLYGCPSGQMANNSAPDFGTWQIDGRAPNSAEENLSLFAMVAGPRKEWTGVGTREISPSAMSAWLDSEEGRRSLPIGEKLGQDLSAGGFTAGTWQEGACKSWQSEGLIFVNNYQLDINPGRGTQIVPINMVLVNTSKLPDAIVAPVAEFLTFMADAKGRGMWNADTRKRAVKAAFGDAMVPEAEWPGRPEFRPQNPQAMQSWNLLRLIMHAITTRDVLPIASVAELAKRDLSAPAADAPRSPSTREGLQLAPRAEMQARPSALNPPTASSATLPDAGQPLVSPPLLAPDVARRIMAIREIALAAARGDLDVIRREERKGGAVARFIRALLRGE